MCKRYFFPPGSFWSSFLMFVHYKSHLLCEFVPCLSQTQAKQAESGVPLHPNCSMATTDPLQTQLELQRPLSFSVKSPTFWVETTRVPASLMDPGVAGRPSVWEVAVFKNTLGLVTHCYTHKVAYFPRHYCVRTPQNVSNIQSVLLFVSLTAQFSWEFTYPDIKKRNNLEIRTQWWVYSKQGHFFVKIKQ